MGLTERKLTQQIKEVTTADNEMLNQKLGFNIPITVDVDSFPNDESVLNEFFRRKIYGLTSVINAIETIAADEIGKEAVQEQIKTIVLANTAKNYDDDGSKDAQLLNGELKISCAFSSSGKNLYKPEELARVIERLLV